MASPHFDFVSFANLLDAISKVLEKNDNTQGSTEFMGKKLQVGTRVPVRMIGTKNFYKKAQILAVRPSEKFRDRYDYYVHFIGYNVRYREWYPDEALDMKAVDPPPKP